MFFNKVDKNFIPFLILLKSKLYLFLLIKHLKKNRKKCINIGI